MFSFIDKNNIKGNNTKGLSDDDLNVESKLAISYIFHGFYLLFRRSRKGTLEIMNIPCRDLSSKYCRSPLERVRSLWPPDFFACKG